MREREHQDDPYWQHDLLLGEAFLEGEPHTIRARLHVAEEHYATSTSREIIPLAQPRGTRSYVLLRPYLLVPDITITVGLFPQPTAQGAIDQVLASEWEGVRHVDIGNAQAWYYPQDRLIVLWECFLHDHYRAADPTKDALTRMLWTSFERTLAERFPQAERIVTPHHEPVYDDLLYRQFLQSLGYSRISKAVFGKPRG